MTERSDAGLWLFAAICQQGERDEGEEPGDVEVEPVRQNELEADQKRAGQGPKLQRRFDPGEECRGDCTDDEKTFEHPLDDVEVRNPACVVLRPVPERER